MKNMKIGIQLYTIREPLKQDFKGVLRELAKLGCDGAEFVTDYGGMEPDELAAFVNEIGLKACGMHVRAAEFSDKAFEYAKALNCRYVTISRSGKFSEIIDDVVSQCTAIGKAAAEHGIQFTYHNHALEFEKINGEYALDIIFNRTDAKQVQSELDVYWVTKGEECPVRYIKKYADRLPQLHMKDMDKEDGSFTELGNGSIDLAACVEAARDTICEWLIYEQDICKRPQFESAKISIEYLKKLLGR